MEKELFEQLVSESTKNLPKKFLVQLKNVALTVQDEPDEYQLQ